MDRDPTVRQLAHESVQTPEALRRLACPKCGQDVRVDLLEHSAAWRLECCGRSVVVSAKLFVSIAPRDARAFVLDELAHALGVKRA